ncbi:MAG: DJ-1/PfpI family protein, partial [Synergistaceae bacterium]|nr:DJ-1/PfpI family protein [Synergistaceae bacterium]
MSKKILALLSDDFEDLELWYPALRLREEKYQVDFAAEKKGAVYHGKYGVPCVSDYSFDEINPDDYDGLLVPGGWAPDKLRRFAKVLE